MADYLDPGLFDALINQESGWDAEAVNSKSGATGLGQITDDALTEFNQYNNANYTMADMKDPQKNMRVSYWYLYDRIPQMLRHYNIAVTPENALWSYNAGIGRVVDNIMPDETKNYISSIMNAVYGR